MPPPGESQRHLYRYRAVTRYIPLMVIAVWVCAGAGLYASVLLRVEYTPPLEKQLWFFAPWLLLIALGIWGQLSYNKRLKVIEVSAAGLWIGEQGRPGCVLLPWERIERVERMPDPRGGRGVVPGRGGIFVWASGRSFVIHEQIRGFDDLWRELQEQLAGRGIAVGR